MSHRLERDKGNRYSPRNHDRRQMALQLMRAAEREDMDVVFEGPHAYAVFPSPTDTSPFQGGLSLASFTEKGPAAS